MSDYTAGTGLSGSSFNVSGAGALGLGSLAVGGLGLGAILGMGESPLPSQFGTAETNAAGEFGQGQNLYNEGQALSGQGANTLDMAAAGQLTPEQSAQLGLYSNALGNQTAQTFASMGRNANQDTTAISAQADNDAKVNAMAQQQIQTSIQLGLGQLSAGSSFTSAGLGAENAANSAIMAAGQAQIQLDQQYNQSLSSAFSAIGNMFGSIGGAAAKALI